MKKLLKAGIVLLLVCSSISVYSEVQLPKIISSNMVLQRNTELRIWGWADKNEKVTVLFNGITLNSKAGKDGKWLVTFPAMKEGGPYEMLIAGKNEIKLTNIMMGDVWVCSGQSNMEFPLSRANNAEEEMAAADYPEIRLFSAPHNIQFAPVDDVKDGEWQVCSPQTVRDFSAVGYFFGRDIYKKINVPIGLLFTSWGGTVVETWISSESMITVPEFKARVEKLATYNPKDEIARRKAEMDKLLKSFGADEKGMVDGKAVWADPDLDVSKWKDMEIPQTWEQAGIEGLDGVVWFRKEFELPADIASAGIVLELGPIDDSDISWVNGTKVGETYDKYNANRVYNVGPGILRPGKNVVVVRVEDYRGNGGLWGKPEQLKIVSGNYNQSLAGTWKFRISPEEIKLDETGFIGPNSNPTLLYNGMIHPFLNYAVKGAIWYQGESNADRAYQYRTLFPLMINDWRKHWNNPEMPFIFVQLANFMAPPEQPGESQWAELREAQSMTLNLNKTGMAVIIDIGEADDIHPRNKQDVGKRLALSALHVAYGYGIVFSGPVYRSMEIKGNKAILHFDHTGESLVVKDRYGYAKGFSVAGADKKFYWAKAYIEDNTVVVYSDNVKEPVAVRYGWADNPDDVNLYNSEGLPASPFRTDDWPGKTVNNK